MADYDASDLSDPPAEQMSDDIAHATTDRCPGTGHPRLGRLRPVIKVLVASLNQGRDQLIALGVHRIEIVVVRSTRRVEDRDKHPTVPRVSANLGARGRGDRVMMRRQGFV